MTLQDDLARPWFQPLDAQHPAPRPDAGPVTTRIAGELSLDEVNAPRGSHASTPKVTATVPPTAPPPPGSGTERIEVTQPYIPAIRDEVPEFAKRLTPQEPIAPRDVAFLAPLVPDDPAMTDSSPVEPGTRSQTAPVDAPAPAETTPTPPAPAAPVEAAPARPRPKRRSLARRVVRRIIGPDLLRKDPPKKR